MKARGGRLDKADVNAALDVRAILDRFGAQYRNGNQREIRIAMCPVCHEKGSGIVVNGNSGEWKHHGGAPECRGGDKLALVAAFAGLDNSREFPRVLELGAEIAGISPDTNPAELARMRAAHDAAREARDRRAAEERTQGEVMVPALWGALPTRHPRGERYLARRGLDPVALRSRGDMVRYYPDGSPAVLLHDLDTGRPINIVRRQIDGKPSKVLSLSLARVLRCDDVAGGFSTEGTLIGRATDIDPDGVDVAVLVEGVTDSLAALLAFPTCAVIGANLERLVIGRRAHVPAVRRHRVRIHLACVASSQTLSVFHGPPRPRAGRPTSPRTHSPACVASEGGERAPGRQFPDLERLVPRHHLRAAIVHTAAAEQPHPTPRRRLPWTDLLKHVFADDDLVWPSLRHLWRQHAHPRRPPRGRSQPRHS